MVRMNALPALVALRVVQVIGETVTDIQVPPFHYKHIVESLIPENPLSRNKAG